MKPAIVTFTDAGSGMAEQVAGAIDGEIYQCGASGDEAKIVVPRLFAEQRPVVGICATG